MYPNIDCTQTTEQTLIMFAAKNNIHALNLRVNCDSVKDNI